MSLFNPSRSIWKTYQEIVTIAPPTLNTLHEVINESGGVKLLFLEVRQTNTPTNNEEIDVLITKDGTAMLYDSSVVAMMNNNVIYGICMIPGNVDQPAYDLDAVNLTAATRPVILSDGADDPGFKVEGQDIKVEIRDSLYRENKTCI